MKTSDKNIVNRCRPGFDASCSFCCGSHNFLLSQNEIEGIFVKRDYVDALSKVHPEDSFEAKLIKDGMQCPYIGISDNIHLCCLIYSEDHEGKVYESFFNGTCKSFLCAAWSELTDIEVLFSAELMKDWYYYSLLINSPEIVTRLCAEYSVPENITEDALGELKIELKRRLLEDDMMY